MKTGKQHTSEHRHHGILPATTEGASTMQCTTTTWTTGGSTPAARPEAKQREEKRAARPAARLIRPRITQGKRAAPLTLTQATTRSNHSIRGIAPSTTRSGGRGRPAPASCRRPGCGAARTGSACTSGAARPPQSRRLIQHPNLVPHRPSTPRTLRPPRCRVMRRPPRLRSCPAQAHLRHPPSLPRLKHGKAKVSMPAKSMPENHATRMDAGPWWKANSTILNAARRRTSTNCSMCALSTQVSRFSFALSDIVSQEWQILQLLRQHGCADRGPLDESTDGVAHAASDKGADKPSRRPLRGHQHDRVRPATPVLVHHRPRRGMRAPTPCSVRH